MVEGRLEEDGAPGRWTHISGIMGGASHSWVERLHMGQRIAL